jgi:hypothetical protein
MSGCALLLLLLQASAETPLEVETMRADLGLLRTVLSAAHPGFERHTAAGEWDELFRAAEARVEAPLAPEQFYCLVAGLVARVGCAHTPTFPPAGLLQGLERGALLPLDVRLEAGRAFVLRDLSLEGVLPEGAEILALDGSSAADVVAELSALTWRDGGVTTYPERVVEESFRRLHALRYGASRVHRLTLAIDGVADTREVVGRSEVETLATRNERHPGRPWPPRPGLELAISPHGGVAVLTVGDFVDARSESFYATSFRAIRERGATGLVLDLRWNGGGYDHLGARLCQYLIPRPFRFYRDMTWRLADPDLLEHVVFELEDWSEYAPFAFSDPTHADPRRDRLALAELLAHYPASHPLLREPTLAPMEDVYTGPLVVLVNGRSASSGGEVPAILHANGRGRFVGEEAGASYQGVRAGILTRLTLPGSRIRVQLPIYQYENAVDPASFPSGGLRPEFTVRADVEDILSGRDPELEFALRLLEKGG